MTHLYTRHDSFVHGTWLVYMWYDSFMCETWLIYKRDMTRSYVIWLFHMNDLVQRQTRGTCHLCDNIYICICIYVYIYIYMCVYVHICIRVICVTRTYMTHVCARHHSLICDMTHSYEWLRTMSKTRNVLCVWHDSFTSVTWLIHRRDMTHTLMTLLCKLWHDWSSTQSYAMYAAYAWHDSLICVTWPINMRMCDMTY